ncbi:MAG: septal ring lytic transglycosylase RlpA family protein [Solirubrobacterales bacterium]
MRRFHWRRKRAALALLPVVLMMITTGIAAAATGSVPTAVPEPGTEATTSGARAESKVKLRVKRHAMAGDSVKISGRVRPGGARWVTVRVGRAKVKTVRARKDGGFRVRWNAPGSGIYRATATAQGTQHAKRARSRPQQVNVYRPAAASYYGPGLYGNGTACGQTLTPSTVGVANKSLPCGTKVTLRHRGRTVTVRVIDRGPYAGNREYDLTAATKAKLGFGSTGTVLTTR